MAIEAKKVLDIDTSASQLSIAQLKKMVAEYKKELDKCIVGSKEAAVAADKLNKAQTALNAAQKGAIDTLGKLDNSYNGLSNQMRKLKDEQKRLDLSTEEGKKAFNDYAKEIGGIQKQLKELDAQNGVYTRNVGNYPQTMAELKTRLAELKDTMVAAGDGTAEYADAMKEAADIQHQMKDMTAELSASAMDFGQIAGNVTGVIGGVVGAFQGAQAAMSLFGVKSEDAVKAMQKMQASMAIVQSLTTLENGFKSASRLITRYTATTEAATVATKALQAAMQPKVLLAITAAIAGIVYAYDKLTEKTRKAKEEQEKLNAEFNDKQAQQVDKYASALDRLRSVNEKLAENLDKRNIIEKWQDDIADNNVEMQKNIAEMERLQHSINNIQGSINAGIKVSDNDKERLELYRQQKNALFDTNQALKTQNKLLEDNIANKQQEEANKKAEEAAKKAKEAAEEQRKEMIELESAAQEALNSINPFISLVDKYRDKPLVIPIQVEEEDEDVDEKFIEYANSIRQRIQNVVATYSQVTLDYKEQYEQDLRDLETAENTNLISHEQFLKAKENLDKEYAKTTKAYAQQELNVYLEMANGFASILSSVADMLDEENEKQFEAIKAFQIASAVISTISGAIGAYMGAASNAGINAIPMVGPALAIALGATNAAVVTASGVAQIAQISKRKFKDGDTSVNTSSLANTSVQGGSMADNVITYTQDVDTPNIEEKIKDTRVYVVESDIQQTGRKVQVAQNESRF